MKNHIPGVLLLVAGLFGAEAFGQETIEKVVVRNRLYSLDRRLEVGGNVGLMVLSRLTDHVNLNGQVAFNLTGTLALQARAGYALSRHTGLANQIAEKFFVLNTAMARVDDLSDLWEMNANALFGVRWAPVYGKLSLLAEVPVHFQAYLWLGAGAGTFHRESLVFCQTAQAGTCTQYLEDRKVAPLVSAALGLRFFTHQRGSFTVELRDYSFPDSYLVGIDRPTPGQGGDTGGTPAPSAGVTNLVLVDLGYSFHF